MFRLTCRKASGLECTAVDATQSTFRDVSEKSYFVYILCFKLCGVVKLRERRSVALVSSWVPNIWSGFFRMLTIGSQVSEVSKPFSLSTVNSGFSWFSDLSVVILVNFYNYIQLCVLCVRVCLTDVSLIFSVSFLFVWMLLCAPSTEFVPIYLFYHIYEIAQLRSTS